MRRFRLFILLAVGAMLGTAFTVGAAGSASADSYNPRPGLILTNPLTKTRWAAQHQIVRTINSVPRGGRIRIMSWNFANDSARKALQRASQRGVSVQLLMAKSQRKHNPVFAKLHKSLPKTNRTAIHKRPGMRSWARVCRGSCRGAGGTAHAKIYLFSSAGHTKDISMWGSSNLTRFAAIGQWNDLYTVDNNSYFYNGLMKVFGQAARDRPVANPLVKLQQGAVSLEIFPWRGAGAHGEPITTQYLDKVRCSGAKNGIGGHTKIRVAINAQLDARGLQIARKLVSLKKAGCNVKVAYAQLGFDAYNAYRAGRVPLAHIVQDFNGDGIYDRYLHNKALVIQGNYAGNPSGSVVVFGSANYSAFATGSDETSSAVSYPGAAARYANWIDRLFKHPPRSHRLLPEYRGMRIDPYAKFDND